MTMQVLLDREKLKAYNLAVPDVLETIEKNSQELPSGSIVKGKRYVNITTEIGLNTPQEMGELPLSIIYGHIVHLKDVATITLGQDTGRFQWKPRFNQKPAVFLAVKKMSGGNVLAISTEVKKLFEKVKKNAPSRNEL